MFMVRTSEQGGYQLAAGEPAFIQDTLQFLNIVEPITEPLRYPSLNGEPELLEEYIICIPNLNILSSAMGPSIV